LGFGEGEQGGQNKMKLSLPFRTLFPPRSLNLDAPHMREKQSDRIETKTGKDLFFFFYHVRTLYDTSRLYAQVGGG
jgi:hypothetical protein